MTETLQPVIPETGTARPDPIDQFRKDVAEGLSRQPKQLSSMYFYDSAGSRLFKQIMDLPEYYLTRCEHDIFKNQGEEIAGHIQGHDHFHLIDLGAGDALKTRILLKQLAGNAARFDYIPVDISANAMQELLQTLQQELPEVPVQALASEYFTALDWLQKNKTGRKVVLFLGSNIGNFDKNAALNFLKAIRYALQPGDKFLVGFDLRKDPLTIRQAYDDAAGITAAFNLNLLERMNRELGADFNLAGFKHYTDYDPIAGVMKSYLISTCDQTVNLEALQQSFHFNAWEPVHTENSFKYSTAEITEMAESSNFEIETIFTDSRQCFADVLFSVK
jgi:L-histidine Nalpha-methyltransferase